MLNNIIISIVVYLAEKMVPALYMHTLISSNNMQIYKNDADGNEWNDTGDM